MYVERRAACLVLSSVSLKALLFLRDQTKMPMTSARFAITVDVEPDWGISGCRAVQSALPRFCERLAAHKARATFFVVAGLLEECGATLRQCLAEHEVASHGLSHRLLDGLSELDALAEMRDSRLRLEDFFGREVTGFRAPFLRPAQSDWWRLLRQAGYAYDSSIGSVSPSRLNVHPTCWATSEHDGIVELPITTLRGGWFPFNLTYLRLMHPLSRKLMHPDARIFFLHLHELADRKLARALPLRLRLPLRRRAGEPAWRLLEEVLTRYGARAATCAEMASTR